ncbi:MAG: hypothetical protein ABSB12_00065 [Candidatus Saccharimonadales bacterium]
MSVRRVRIYNGIAENSNVIGFSASAVDAPSNPRFASFMAERGYTWNEAIALPSGSVSCRHIEVRPPLSEKHIKELGILCVGGFIDDKLYYGIVDPYHDGVQVLDNRSKLPEQSQGLGELIAWC